MTFTELLTEIHHHDAINNAHHKVHVVLDQQNGELVIVAERLEQFGKLLLLLTPQASGRYGYLLKLSLEGNPKEAVLSSLKITTWVQVAPASLPALRAGLNRMEFRSGDHYGLATRVMEIGTNGSDRLVPGDEVDRKARSGEAGCATPTAVDCSTPGRYG